MTSKKSEWNLTINEKNRFSYLDPNGLFIICKYCERFGNSVNQDVGRINMRRPFIGANTDKWSDHASTRMHRLSLDKWSKMVDKGVDPEKSKRKADTQITSFFNKKNKSAPPQKSHQIPKESPLYHRRCNGVFSLHEILNSNDSDKWKRNAELQLGLNIKVKYFLDHSTSKLVVKEVPGLGKYNLFSSVGIF